MLEFLIIYKGGAKQPKTKEEGALRIKKWKEWVASLGSAIINPCTPLKGATILSKEGIKENYPDAIHGYMIIRADNMAAALEIAKSDPYYDLGGTLEMAQIIKMG